MRRRRRRRRLQGKETGMSVAVCVFMQSRVTPMRTQSTPHHRSSIINNQAPAASTRRHWKKTALFLRFPMFVPSLSW